MLEPSSRCNSINNCRRRVQPISNSKVVVDTNKLNAPSSEKRHHSSIEKIIANFNFQDTIDAQRESLYKNKIFQIIQVKYED